jgi:hypothetical protein
MTIRTFVILIVSIILCYILINELFILFKDKSINDNVIDMILTCNQVLNVIYAVIFLRE